MPQLSVRAVAAAGLLLIAQALLASAQAGVPVMSVPARPVSSFVRPVADLSSQYVRPGTVQPEIVELDKKKGKFEFFDVDNLAGMAGGAIAAGIADQRRAEYYRQDFFYGGRPYYGTPYYGGPAYYGGSYSTYYYRK
ncbi:MAG: hypothetical protein EKK40_03155 [Bradyrhizobiaceae bacterium]|nr:MAG: hypothetical protein EKK40_03155 [Bradyrhizobiaceae bacterium]